MPKEAGLITICDPGADRPLIESPTVQCVHCGCHFQLKPSKPLVIPMTAFEAEKLEAEGRKTRGWCHNCRGYVCGPGCAACIPTEQLLENMEKGRPEDFRPVVCGWTPAMG